MAELAFEYLLAGLETTRGTAVNPPTRYLNLSGTLTPKKQRYRPPESRGTLAEYYRSVDVRKWSEFEAEGGLDVYTLPLILNALLKGGVTTPSTPPDAILTHLWEFEPTMDADDLQSLTLYWGDPNIQAFQAAFCMPDELTISADASGTDGVTISVSGQGHFPSKTSPSSVPAMLDAPLLMPSAMQVWIDTTNPIGTTEIVGRVVSTEWKITSGISRKWLAAGPTGDLEFGGIGRGKRHAEAKLVLELDDTTEYDQWVAATTLKTRIRLNGPAIETVGTPGTTYYHYVQLDIYGPFETLEWGELEGTNRTVELTILSEYDDTAGYDFALFVQNDRATL